MTRSGCRDRIGKGGMLRYKNAGKGNHGKNKAEHVTSPVPATSTGANLEGQERHSSETLHSIARQNSGKPPQKSKIPSMGGTALGGCGSRFGSLQPALDGKRRTDLPMH